MATAITVTVDAVNYTFTPDSVQPDVVRFVKGSSTLVNPDTLLLRRVYPKVQKSFPGVARNNLKTSKMITYADGVRAPILFEASISRRADTDATDFNLQRKIFGQLIADGELDGFFASLSL